MNKLIPLALIAALVAVALFFRRGRDEFYYAGTVEATEVTVPARLNSVIEKYHAELGAEVKKGQLLAELDCRAYNLAASIAGRDFDRARQLLADGTMPQAQYDAAKYRDADARLKAGWCRVYAPIAGTVLYKPHEESEFTAPGTPLVTIADTSRVYAYIYVEQSAVYRIKTGMKAAALLPEDNMRRIDGTVTAVNEKAEFTPRNVQTRKERTRLVYQVKLEFDNRDGLLKPGMTIEARPFPENGTR
ncbi:MAG: efflux RND transporter periplasmic adaptor subunit [Elusimicrobiaceae bacterium]|nr:efflux RND transporter periplasmic adaptor subunit [Elusimicrobiaceae bacterium]